jgi:YegS/Rv2252/BmrU family lipid kinase
MSAFLLQLAFVSRSRTFPFFLREHLVNSTEPFLNFDDDPVNLPRARVFAVLNPRSGSCTIDDVRRAIDEHLATAEVEIHEVLEGNDLREIVRDALRRGFDPIIAAGGDGTVSTVADVLVGTSAHLIIFPLGTANVLARELGIPIELAGATKLGAGRVASGSLAGQHHEVIAIDAMKVGDHHYFTQIGVGLDSLMIRDTSVDHKRRFGRLAYLWTALGKLVGYQPRRYYLTIDGQKIHVKASQVLVANTGMMGQPGFRWGPNIRPDDAQLDLCVCRARSFLDFAEILWHVIKGSHKKSSNVHYEVARRQVIIDAKHPLPVQADGEILGPTPVTIEVVAQALHVVVPVGLMLTGSENPREKAEKPD